MEDAVLGYENEGPRKRGRTQPNSSSGNRIPQNTIAPTGPAPFQVGSSYGRHFALHNAETERAIGHSFVPHRTPVEDTRYLRQAHDRPNHIPPTFYPAGRYHGHMQSAQYDPRVAQFHPQSHPGETYVPAAHAETPLRPSSSFLQPPQTSRNAFYSGIHANRNYRHLQPSELPYQRGHYSTQEALDTGTQANASSVHLRPPIPHYQLGTYHTGRQPAQHLSTHRLPGLDVPPASAHAVLPPGPDTSVAGKSHAQDHQTSLDSAGPGSAPSSRPVSQPAQASDCGPGKDVPGSPSADSPLDEPNALEMYFESRDEQILYELRQEFRDTLKKHDEDGFTGSYVHSLLEPLYPPLPRKPEEEPETLPFGTLWRRFNNAPAGGQQSTSVETEQPEEISGSRRSRRIMGRKKVKYSNQDETETEEVQDRTKAPTKRAAPVIGKPRTKRTNQKKEGEFFRPHPTKKGYIVCKRCNTTHWPPNREKHLKKCLSEKS